MARLEKTPELKKMQDDFKYLSEKEKLAVDEKKALERKSYVDGIKEVQRVGIDNGKEIIINGKKFSSYRSAGASIGITGRSILRYIKKLEKSGLKEIEIEIRVPRIITLRKV